MNKNIEYIGIDHGNYQMKTVNSISKSAILERTSAPGERGKLDNVLVYKNKYYQLKTEAELSKTDKTDNEKYYILTLISLAKEINARNMDPMNSEVRLSIGMPPGYYNEQKALKWRQYLTKSNPVNFSYDNVDYRVVIDGVDVYMQGLGTLMFTDADIANDVDNDFVLVDIGGGTTEIVAVSEGVFVPDKILSISSGIYKLGLKIKKELERALDDTPAVSVDRILKIIRKYPDGDQKFRNNEINKAIMEQAEIIFNDFSDEILTNISNIDMDPKIVPVLLSGGGSSYLYPYLKDAVYELYTEPDVKANAAGYERISKFAYTDKDNNE